MSIVKNVNPDVKITHYLDKVLFLYKSLDNGIKVNKCEFDILYDRIIILCNININKSLLCLLSYYIENDIIRKNKYMNSEPKLKNIIISMLDKNLDISYDYLSLLLKKLYYIKYEEDYDTSLYKKVKDKVIILNRLRSDKTNCTFYDIMDMFDQILYNFIDDYYDKDTIDKNSIELYDKICKVLNSDNCNIVDNMNNTLLTFILSKYYNGYCREIQYNDMIYSMKNMIDIIINNNNFNWNIVNSYNLNILSMIQIIKKYGTEYEEYHDMSDLEIEYDDIYNIIKNKFDENSKKM
jgi:hypothetical protein